MRRKKMKINGLFIFSLVIGTFSLSLNRNTIQADLTENATTLPSVDIAKRNTGVYTDSDFSVYSIETTIQTPDVEKDKKEKNVSQSEQETVYSRLHEDNLQQNYNSEDEAIDSDVTTTVRPQPHPSYFAQFRARRNAECNSEVGNVNFEAENKDSPDVYCTGKNEETTNDNENIKEKDRETEIFTEKCLDNITVHEETTDISQYKNTQGKLVDDTQIESSGQDTNSSTRFHLDLKSILLNKRIMKRDAPKEVEMPTLLEEMQTTISPITLDYTDNYDYYQFANAVENPSLAVRLLYKIGYLYSIMDGGTLHVNKIVTDFSTKLKSYLGM